MSAATSGHQISYKVVKPTPKDLGVMVPLERVAQKFRKAENKAGPPESGIVIGSNTNLGSKWWISGVDRKERLICYPFNGKDEKGRRYMPRFKVDALFRLDEDQP
jgi:hypothetical protein